MTSKNYQPVEREGHSTIKVGDYLYMWGGYGSGVHYDVIEVYHLPTGAWDQKPTTGTPPTPGINGYSSAAIGKDVYYFGGYGDRYQNSLHCFNVDSFNWRELSPSSSDYGPMEKAYCGMVSAHFDGEDYLVIIGGVESFSINILKQPEAQYSAFGRCNEIHYYRISSDQWISPVVTGDRPPPIHSFTLTPVTNNTAVMFGGLTDNGVSNKLYMISFTKTSVDILEVPNPGGSVQWPKRSWAHSDVLITTSLGPHLLVVGGLFAFDVWLLDINKRKWKKLINLPVNITDRYCHSLSVWSVTPTTNWIIEFGGRRDDLTTISNTAVIELRYNSDNDWSTSVIPLDQYQDQLQRRILSDWENLGMEKQLQIVKDHLQQREREFYQEQLQREIKENKKQIQVHQDKEHQQLLQEKATLTRQLDDATTLLEQAEKDKSTLELVITEFYKKLKVKVAEILDEKAQVEEKKQITEDYEKLKLKVAELLEEKENQYLKEKQVIIDDNQNSICEKDEVVAKLTSQVEEQSQNEKQIITDLRAKVSDNELYTNKLMKEKSQLQERVTSLEEQSIKQTSSIGLQFNYLIPSMDNLDCLSDVQVAEKKLFLVQGEKPRLINWEKYGLRIGVPKDTLSPTNTFEVAVAALVGGQFVFPKNTVLVSAVYAVAISKALLKPLRLEIEHCIDLWERPGLTRFLKFAIAPVSTPSLPYQFSIVEGGVFKPDSCYGSIQRKEFCLVAIVGEKHQPKPSTNGDESEEEEEEQEEQAEEETEEEVKDGNSDSSSDSDKTKDPPGGSSGGKEESTSNEGVEKEGETGGQPLHEEGIEEQDNKRVEESKDHEEATAPLPCTEISSDFNSKLVVSTGIVENMTYAGKVYYEEKRAVTFTAAKKLSALIEFIEKKHVQAEIDEHVYFSYGPSYSYIELKFDAPQDEPCTGWIIEPHLKPCRLHRFDVDNFGNTNYSVPSCLISIYGLSGAVSSLHYYSVPLVGVVDPVTLLIHCSLRTATPPPPLPSRNPTTSSSSSSNVVQESTSVSRASTFRSDIAHRVMIECTGTIKENVGLYPLIDRLVEKRIISDTEKGRIIDTSTGLTANQRMDELLNLVKASIRENGEDFRLFLELIEQEDTKRADRLALTLLENYKKLL